MCRHLIRQCCALNDVRACYERDGDAYKLQFHKGILSNLTKTVYAFSLKPQIRFMIFTYCCYLV